MPTPYGSATADAGPVTFTTLNAGAMVKGYLAAADAPAFGISTSTTHASTTAGDALRRGLGTQELAAASVASDAALGAAESEDA